MATADSAVDAQRLGKSGLLDLFKLFDPEQIARAITVVERLVALLERIFPKPVASQEACAEPSCSGGACGAAELPSIVECYASEIAETLANGERLKRILELVAKLKGRISPDELAALLSQLAALMAAPQNYAAWITFVTSLLRAIATTEPQPA